MPVRNRTDLPAKLSRPRRGDTVPRLRLVERLDNIAGRTVWVAGPPGSGKTSLLADYVARRKLACLWYQLDPGDDDPAHFFGYLARAAAPFLGYRRRLPLLRRELLPGLPTFTRRFFEALCEALPRPAWLVFDDYHQIGDESPMHEVLAAAAESIPDGVTLAVASRRPPPDTMARLQLHGGVAGLGWPDLRLTPDEARHIAGRAAPEVPDGRVERLYALSDGWLAGLLLLLRGGGDDDELARWAGRAALYPYFARELFETLHPSDRHALMLAAQTPNVDEATFRSATGGGAGIEPVRRLAAADFFVTRSGDNSRTYTFHPLFREFLLDRSAKCLPAEDMQAYHCQLANVLARKERFDEAVPLLLSLGDHEAAAKLVRRHAPELMRTGRVRTLEAWLRRLPENANDPWLEFWRAQSKLASDPMTARDMLMVATRSFIEEGDAVGAYTAWGAAVESCVICWDQLSVLGDWLRLFDELQSSLPLPPAPEVEVRVIGGLLLAATWHEPRVPDIDRWAQRIAELIDDDVDTGTALAAASHLITWYLVRGDMPKIAQLKETIGARMAAEASADIVTLVTWKSFLSLYHWCVGEAGASLDASADCERLSVRHGLDELRFRIAAQRACAHVLRGDTSAVREAVDVLGARRNPARQMQSAHWHLLAGVAALMEGKDDVAREHAARSLEIACRGGATLSAALAELVLAQCLFECGKADAARGLLGRGRAWSEDAGFDNLTWAHLLVDAYYHDRLGDTERARARLRDAFALGAEKAMHYTGLIPRRIYQRLAAVALRQGVEPTYARRLIETLGLVPSPADRDLEAWPWPLRIYTLGSFRIVRDGVELTLRGRHQRKPLELLKTLIALGGRDVRGEVLGDALWPDAPAEAVKRNFDTTLYRLRRLLALDHAVLMEGGKVSLNPELCWTDAWSLGSTLDRTSGALAGKGGGAVHDLLARLQEGLLERYAGDFLDGEAVEITGVTWREFYRTATAETLLRLGDHWRAQGQRQRAREAYQGARRVDPLLEDAYRDLIRLALDDGNYAEAISHYESCAAILDSELGVLPAESTRMLVESSVERARS